MNAQLNTVQCGSSLSWKELWQPLQADTKGEGGSFHKKKAFGQAICKAGFALPHTWSLIAAAPRSLSPCLKNSCATLELPPSMYWQIRS